MSYYARLIGSMFYYIVCGMFIVFGIAYLIYANTGIDLLFDFASTKISTDVVCQSLISLMMFMAGMCIYMIYEYARPFERR